MEEENYNASDRRLADSENDSSGSESSENQSDFSLSCSSPFESHNSGSDLHEDIEEEAEGTVEPYMFEPTASSSGESPSDTDSNDSEDLSRLTNTG